MMVIYLDCLDNTAFLHSESCEFQSDLIQCIVTDLVLNERLISTEELQAMADPQYILSPPRLLLRPVGGQPLPNGQLHQLSGGAG